MGVKLLMMSPEKVAEALSVHRSTVDRLMRLPSQHPDHLRSVKFGQGKRKAIWRVKEEWLLEWVDRHEGEATTRQMSRPSLRVAESKSPRTFSQGFTVEGVKRGIN